MAQPLDVLLQEVGNLTFLGVSAAFVGALLGVAGLLKIVDPLPTAIAAVNFGVARAPNKRLAYATGIGEVLLGAALISQRGGPWPAWLSLALFLAFGALIATALRSGRRFDCGCFGDESRSIGWSHVAVLVCLSLLVLNLGLRPPSVPSTSRWTQMTIAGVGLFGVFGVGRQLRKASRHVSQLQHDLQAS
jgi:uncharacterized membrane protein YphA (DoxX/SURF4 family)